MKIILTVASLLVSCLVFAQVPFDTDKDALTIRSIFDTGLAKGDGYQWLHTLTKGIGGRLAGSPNGAAAIEYCRQMLDTISMVDTVFLQPVLVPHWERGEAEQVRIVNSAQIGTQDLHAFALGGSAATPQQGLVGEVIEVKSLADVQALGDKVKGKIIFFNRPMDPLQINTFNAYGNAVDQRASGPNECAKLGALAAVVRSMTLSLDEFPHTGGTRFEEGVKPIPAVAISTSDAELLSTLLSTAPQRIFIKTSCQRLADKLSYNVVAQINGTVEPDRIIVVGGHLDSWDVNEGAHDDGAGVVHSMEVLNIFSKMGIRPKHTIRCVLFANEENGLAGGKEYAKLALEKGEKHLVALESDSGGFTPRGFSIDGGDETTFLARYKRFKLLEAILSPYGIDFVSKEGSGADISPLRPQKVLLIGFRPDSQRYFDYHHAASDTFDKVNKRELLMGASAITSLIYLIDKYTL
jgi:carboxypeptidase Q